MMYRDVSQDAHRQMILIGGTLEQWLLDDARRQPDRNAVLTPDEMNAALERFLQEGVHEFARLVATATEQYRSDRAAA